MYNEVTYWYSNKKKLARIMNLIAVNSSLVLVDSRRKEEGKRLRLNKVKN